LWTGYGNGIEQDISACDSKPEGPSNRSGANSVAILLETPVTYAHTNTGSVSFERLTDAFGPSSLGIIIVKDLPLGFQDLRAEVLSNASYLANLPEEELGKNRTV
jgi:hypothetical protein